MTSRLIYTRAMSRYQKLAQLANFKTPSQPLLHTIIFLIEMGITARLVTKYNSYYADKPGRWPIFLLWPIFTDLNQFSPS